MLNIHQLLPPQTQTMKTLKLLFFCDKDEILSLSLRQAFFSQFGGQSRLVNFPKT